MTGTSYTVDMIGMRESTLHRDLKSYYAYCSNGLIEQSVCGYRIDVLAGQHAYEIQTREFYRIRPKLSDLISSGYGVTVVYPIQEVLESRLTLGGIRRRRRRAKWIKAFDELVYLAKMLQKEGLSVELLKLHERATGRRSRRNRVRNTRLVAILDRLLVEKAGDLHRLLPADLPDPFTTKDIMGCAGVGKRLASRTAYTLKHSGASEKVGSRGRYALYRLVDEGSEAHTGEELRDTPNSGSDAE
jgi:hypothetical protein